MGRVTGGSLVPAGCKTTVSAKNVVGETCSFGLLSACSIEDHGLTAEAHSFIHSSVTSALKAWQQWWKQQLWLLKTKLYINVCVTVLALMDMIPQMKKTARFWSSLNFADCGGFSTPPCSASSGSAPAGSASDAAVGQKQSSAQCLLKVRLARLCFLRNMVRLSGHGHASLCHGPLERFGPEVNVWLDQDSHHSLYRSIL